MGTGCAAFGSGWLDQRCCGWKVNLRGQGGDAKGLEGWVGGEAAVRVLI